MDCIVNACLFCHLQFDGGQMEIAKKEGKGLWHFCAAPDPTSGAGYGYSVQDVGLSQNAVALNEFVGKTSS